MASGNYIGKEDDVISLDSFQQNTKPKATSNVAKTKTSTKTLPSLGEFYANTINKMKNDPANRAAYELALNTVTTDPTSPYYNPYSQATTTKANESNVVRTQKALAELDDINNQIKYWASRTDKNYSDDEIVSMIDLSNYSTLKTLESDRQKGFPSDLLAPVDYSEAALRGMVWSARNNGQTSGNYAVDSAMNYIGRGNVSPEVNADPRRDATSPMYAPYAIRQDSLSDLEYRYGMTGSFSREWLESVDGGRALLAMADAGDKQAKTDYNRIQTAIENTEKYAPAAEAFNAWMQQKYESGMSWKDLTEGVAGTSSPLELAWANEEIKPAKDLWESTYDANRKELITAIDFDMNGWKNKFEERDAERGNALPSPQYESDISNALGASFEASPASSVTNRRDTENMAETREILSETATPEERQILSTDDGSYNEVKVTVGKAIETGTAGREDAHNTVLASANDYAAKNLLVNMQTIDKLKSDINAFNTYQAFYDKWNFKVMDDPKVQESHEYKADKAAAEPYFDIWYANKDRGTGAWEEEITQLGEERREIMQGYSEARNLSGGREDNTVVPLVGFLHNVGNLKAEDFKNQVYDWQEQLADGSDWGETLQYINQTYEANLKNIQLIDDSLEMAKAYGVVGEYVEGAEALKTALQNENAMIGFAKVRSKADFDEKIKEFDATNEYKAPKLGGNTAVEIINAYLADPDKATGKNKKWYAFDGDYTQTVAEDMVQRDSSAAGMLEAGNVLSRIEYMTEDEKKTYKYLYATGGEKTAFAYINTLWDALNYRGYKAAVKSGQIEGGKQFVGKNAKSVIINATSGLNFIYNAGIALEGGEIDPYSPNNWATYESQAIRESAGEKIDEKFTNPFWNKVAHLGYDSGMMAADSFAATALGGGNQYLSIAAMGLSAANSTSVDVLMRGGTEEQAVLMGGIAAIAESATEFLPMEELIGSFKKGGGTGKVKDWLMAIVKGSITDAPGEVLSEVIGKVSDDAIMQEASNTFARVEQLINEEGLDPDEAEKIAQKEFAESLLYTAMTAAFSQGVSNTVAFGTGKISSLISREKDGSGKKDKSKAKTETETSSGAKTETATEETAEASSGETEVSSNGIVDAEITPEKSEEDLSGFTPQQIFHYRATIALNEAGKSNVSNTERAATLSAVLTAAGVEPDAADAIAMTLSNDKVYSYRRIVNRLLMNIGGNVSPEIIQRNFSVAAANPKSYMGANFSIKSRTNLAHKLGEHSDAILYKVLEKERADAAAFIKNSTKAAATVANLRDADKTAYKKAKEATSKALQAVNAANGKVEKAKSDVASAEAAVKKAANDLRKNPADENAAKALTASAEKKATAQNNLKAAEESANAANGAYQAAVREQSEAGNAIMLEARANAEAQVAEKEAAAEVAKQERAKAEAEKQEADNLSEMEFQSYVEETAPDATPEQVEAMREGFKQAEQQNAEQAPATPEEAQLTKTQRTAKALGKRFGMEVEFRDLGEKINGGYDSTNNKLLLNSRLTQDEAIIRTVAHELTHKAERGGLAYDTFATALLDIKYKGDRKKLNADIQKRLGKENAFRANAPQTQDSATYGMDLRYISEKDARKEIVADLVSDILYGDEALIEELVNKDIDTAYTFFDRLKDVIKRLVGIKGNAADQLKRTRDLFEKALAKAAGNGAKTTKQRVAESKHPASVQFSIDQWAKATGFNFERSAENKGGYIIVDQDGNKVDKVTKGMMVNTPAGRLVTTALGKGTMTATDANNAYQFLADVMNMVVEFEDQETVWELVGSALFSSVKNNSDKQYGRTVDYGTICSKTRDIVNVMSETMLEKGRGLTREEVIMAYNKTFGEGMSVPCPPCYVFSRWMGVPSLLETMRKGQERFANATDADVNEYINGVKERYAGELAKTKKNGEAKTLAEVMGTRKTNILNKLDAIRQEVASERFDESALDKVREQQKALEAELEDIELYNWVTQVLCETDSKGKPIEKNGKVSIDKKFKAVPNEVLLDMRKTGEFASGYAKAWRFRTTRGAGMGKAQLPYAGAEVGDVLTGAKRWKANENPFYTGDDAKAKRALANAAKRTKAQNLIGGNRFQSTSDFRPEWGLDYLMTFFEMEAIGAKGQLYTKVIEAVDLFASAGVEVNLSVMAKGDGWHLDENGNPVITLEDFSPVTGINAEQAMQKAQEYDNVQLILVGMNDTHIELALADDRISFVIPWHSSGNSKEVLGQMMEAVGEKRGKAQDYSDFQTDKIGNQTPEQKAAWDLRKKILTGGFFVKGKAVEPTEAEMATIAGNDYLLDLYNKMYVDETSDSYHVKLSAAQASQIFPHEYWDTNSTYDTADVNGKRFVEYCESMGIEPRFPQFVDKKGYWKLLIDRRMYGRDGNYRPAGYISTSNIKVNALPQTVSQAKPGTNEQIQNAKQKLIDEIDARTAEQHKFDLSAEHAAPAPAIPANVQFSLRDDSSNDWDVDASVEDNIANTARAKELDEEISRLQAEYKAAEKKYNKATKGMSVERFRELRASGDPIITEFTKAQEAYESAKSEREWLVRNVPKDVRDAAKKYLGLKDRYDQTMEYYKAKPKSSLREEAEIIAKDMAVAKREYEELLNPYLEKRKENEAKRIERETASAPQMPVETEAVEEQTVEQPVETVAEQPVAEETVVEETPTPEEPSNEPSGIYAEPKAGDDSDYGAEDEPVKPTNEFTYGTLDPAFKIPEAPKGKRVHDTSRKIVADESLPDAVRLEEAKPENSQYEQDSNEAQHNRAAEIIRRRGIDNEYERLMKLDSASSPDDIAEILILEQFYNREGTRDMEKLLGVTKKKRQLSAVAATILQSTKSEIAKMSPTELVSRFLGESEDSLENFIKERPNAAEKIKERADAKTEALSAAVAGKSLDEVSEDNKWYTPLNAAQMAVIKEYGLENVERAGIFYNRATVKQRMLEAIIQTKDPFAMTGMGMNLIERLEYIRSGEQAITIADLNYIQRNLGEFSFFDGLQGGRVSDLALNRALEAYGNTKTASFFEKYRSMRYINMLTSFTSALKNIIGNAGGVVFLDATHEVENVVDLGISLITGKREKQTLTLQERLAGWKAFKDESVNTFRDYFVDKVDTNPKNDPFNKHRKGRVYQGKVEEGARNLQGFLMSFGDRNFWKRAFVRSMAEQQKLLDKGLLLNEDGSVPTMDQMIERAKGEADYAVLSEDNFVSKEFRRLAVEHPVAAELISYYMPFTGVPTNVIKRGVEYSPLNAVATVCEALWRGFRGKKFNQKKFVEGVCRPLTTAGVYMLGSMLYNAGKIKMGTGDDEDEGTKYYDARTALGDQYSAYLVDDISGTNASLSSLGTVGTMLLFGAAMSSELDKQGEDGKRLMVAVWNALNHSIDSIVDASYLSGITDFFNSNLDEPFLETGIRLFGENVAGQMVGAPVAQFAEYLDPYVRDTKDKNKIIEIYKSVANKIPYLRETLPKKVYVTGTVAETRRPPVTKFVDPFTRSHQYEEPELEEAMRLYEFAKSSGDEKISADKNKVLPEDVLRGKKNSFTYKSVEYELNDEQKEAYKLKYGEIWTAKVAEIMNGGAYEHLSDGEKFAMFKQAISKAKSETMEWAIANLID